jgi:hypothetical protein
MTEEGEKEGECVGRKMGEEGEGGGMCEEEEVERGRRRGNVWGGRGIKWEKEGECVRKKRWKGGEGGGMCEEEE